MITARVRSGVSYLNRLSEQGYKSQCYFHILTLNSKEEFEDTKAVIRILTIEEEPREQ
jgi:hypothetical protein